MDCQEYRRMLDRDGDLTDPDAVAHLRDCAACREATPDGEWSRQLNSARPGGASTQGPSFEELSDRISDSESLRERVRQMGRPSRLAVPLAVCGAAAALIATFLLRPDWAVYPAGRMWSTLAVFAAATCVSATCALRPLHREETSVAWLLTGPAVLVLIGFGIAAQPAAHRAMDASLRGTGDMLIPGAITCLSIGLAFGLPVAAAVRWVDRAEYPTLRSSLYAGVAGGLFGNLGLQLFCPIVHPAHLLLGHAPATLLMGLAGFGLHRALSARR